MQKITLGFSPCPNDTFIFDAIVNKKIDLKGLDFEVILADVEALNQMANRGELEVTKLSYYAYTAVQKSYILLNSGSALGYNCGPLVIAKPDFNTMNMDKAKIYIPGVQTTANFLFTLKYPNAKNKQAVLFSEIEDAVVKGDADLGLIIHENRFTYQDKGLIALADLGEFWQNTTGYPIPLGGIAAKRSLSTETLQLINELIKESVLYAFANTADAMPYIKEHAQAMEEAVMLQHINLYVNKNSIDLGNEGKEAIRFMYNKAQNLGLIKEVASELFVNP